MNKFKNKIKYSYLDRSYLTSRVSNANFHKLRLAVSFKNGTFIYISPSEIDCPVNHYFSMIRGFQTNDPKLVDQNSILRDGFQLRESLPTEKIHYMSLPYIIAEFLRLKSPYIN